MSQHKTPPIFSTCEDDPSQGEAIGRFVIALAEEVDRLQDAELEGDFAQLSDLVTRLGERAQALGWLCTAKQLREAARTAGADC